MLFYSAASSKYEARLEDGSLVAKSDGVEFTIKEGHFCPAFAKAVKTMNKGEKVLLTVKPQYGFGEKGKPKSGDEGVVLPNAMIQITFELVSWNTVTEVKDDKAIKKILKEGEGYERPNEGATVKFFFVHLAVKLVGKLQKICSSSRQMKQVIEGLDGVVMTMKKGEVALPTIAPEYAFGSSKSHQELTVVPPNLHVYYEVELVFFDKDLLRERHCQKSEL